MMSPMASAQDAVALFRAEAEVLSSLQELRALFVNALAPFGVTGFAVGHLKGGGRPTTLFITTWPRKLMELYAINAFMVDDPVVCNSILFPDIFEWPNSQANAGYDNRVLETFRQFGFASGLAVPVHGPKDARGVVALLAQQRPFPTYNRSVQVGLARSCYLIARRLYDNSVGRAKLSRRERQALSLVAKGLDDEAIASVLGVTKISAHVYVERAKRRIGARTRAQAVALAMTNDLID